MEGASADVCIVAINNGDQDVTVSGQIVGPGKMIKLMFTLVRKCINLLLTLIIIVYTLHTINYNNGSLCIVTC